MGQQDERLNVRSLADEIGKYFLDKTRCLPLPEMIDLTIEMENYGFKPTALKKFSIAPDLIKMSDLPYITFSADGIMTFKDSSSGVCQNQDVTFSGVARIADFNGRLYVDKVMIKSLAPLYPLGIDKSK